MPFLILAHKSPLFQVKFSKDTAMLSEHESMNPRLSNNCKIINQNCITQYDLQAGKMSLQNCNNKEDKKSSLKNSY